MKTILYKPKKHDLYKKNILIINTGNSVEKILFNQLLKLKSKLIIIENNLENKKYNTQISENLSVYPINSLLYTYNDYLTLSHIIKKTYNYINNIIIINEEPEILHPIKQYSLNKWNNILQINLNNIVLLIKAFIPLLNNTNYPSITLTLYPQHKISKAFFGAYACANSGLNALMNILNNEYNHLLNIRINGISVSKIKTKSRKNIYVYEHAKSLKTIENTINCYTFLASNNSKYIKNKILIPNKNFTINITL